MLLNVIDDFKNLINPKNTRIQNLPPIILVFGGVLNNPSTSYRAMFMNWMLVNKPPILQFLRTPEDYEDWDRFDGYSNLMDFEKDAGYISKAIILFSESPGSFAELGAFCMDDNLSERLFVVVSEEKLLKASFISHGPIKKIELLHEDSICRIENDNPAELQSEIPRIIESLTDKINATSKTQIFDPQRERDQFLLVADLIELFSAITLREIESLLEFMSVVIDKQRLETIINQLKRFSLIEEVPKYSKKYFVPPKDRHSYLNYNSLSSENPFDRTRFKLKNYNKLNSDIPRFKAYNTIHSEAKK